MGVTIPLYSLKLVKPNARNQHTMLSMYHFGTDGIRGLASELISSHAAYHLGRVLGKFGNSIMIARDVRTHSQAFEEELCRGLLETSARIFLCGILPTPALSYAASEGNMDYAVMITASHNAPEFNGLKVFGKGGSKLSEEEERRIEKALLDSVQCNDFSQSFQAEIAADLALAPDYSECSTDENRNLYLSEDERHSALSFKLCKSNHRVRIVDGAETQYKKYVKSLFPKFGGIKVRLDCAHGCFAEFAKEVFEDLDIAVIAENDTRSGDCVNVNCGSTHISDFVPRVKDDEIGFAFDGDGDRVIAVADGKIYDGDAILLAISTLYRMQGKLCKKFVVGTVLTSSRLQKELALRSTALVRADVGDKHVLDAMKTVGCVLGGEKSGHILMLDKAKTGDGLLTALTLLEVKRTVGQLPKFSPFPMLEFNIPSQNPNEEITSPTFMTKKETVLEKFGSKGRLIVRPSGTEPYIRVAFECFAPDADSVFSDIKSIFLT